MDEKPQVHALERAAPVLPMIPGVPERRSFDYVRHGTVDLFAALNTATGKVITKLSAQHRAVDFRDFLDEIDRRTDPGLAVHVIRDDLKAALENWIKVWKDEARPFKWTKTADPVLDRICRYCHDRSSRPRTTPIGRPPRSRPASAPCARAANEGPQTSGKFERFN